MIDTEQARMQTAEQSKRMILSSWPIMVIDLMPCDQCDGQEMANEYPEARCPVRGGAGVRIKNAASPMADRQSIYHG